MAVERFKSKRYTGVYYRDSLDKRFNGKPDRAYEYTYRDSEGKKKWVTVGWLSEGFSELEASQERADALRQLGKRRRSGVTPLEPAIELSQASSVTNEVNTNVIIAAPSSESVKDLSIVDHPLLLNEIAEYYFTWMEGEGKHASRERSRFNKNVRDIIGWLPEKDIDKLIARDFKADLLKIMAVDSARKCLALCRSIYYHAKDSGYIETANPFSRESGFKMPKPQNKCERYLEPDEVLILMPELKRRNRELHDMAFVSLYTGARSTEIFTIRGADIVPKGLYFWVNAKGGTREKVMANEEVINILLSYERRPGEYIFQTPSGKPFSEIPDIFRRVVEGLGLSAKTKTVTHSKETAIKKSLVEKQQDRRKKVWFHTLRHTFASWLAQSGSVTLHELRELMRHSSIQMTERYAHMIPGSINQQSSLIQSVMMNQYKKRMVELNGQTTDIDNSIGEWIESVAGKAFNKAVGSD